MDTRQLARTYLLARAPDLDAAELSELSEPALWEAAAWVARERLSEKFGLRVQNGVSAIELDASLGEDPADAVSVLRECGIAAPPQGALARMREAVETPRTLSDPSAADDLPQCEVCGGNGITGARTCPHCDGSGHEPPSRQRISSDRVVGNRHAEPPASADNRRTLSDPGLAESERAAFRAEWLERSGFDPALALDGVSETQARSRFRAAMAGPQATEDDYDEPEYAGREGALLALRESGVR